MPRHTTGIASPWWVDRLPSHISKMAESTVSGGDAPGTRTPNLVIKSHLLCQLS